MLRAKAKRKNPATNPVWITFKSAPNSNTTVNIYNGGKGPSDTPTSTAPRSDPIIQEKRSKLSEDARDGETDYIAKHSRQEGRHVVVHDRKEAFVRTPAWNVKQSSKPAFNGSEPVVVHDRKEAFVRTPAWNVKQSSKPAFNGSEPVVVHDRKEAFVRTPAWNVKQSSKPAFNGSEPDDRQAKYQSGNMDHMENRSAIGLSVNRGGRHLVVHDRKEAFVRTPAWNVKQSSKPAFNGSEPVVVHDRNEAIVRKPAWNVKQSSKPALNSVLIAPTSNKKEQSAGQPTLQGQQHETLFRIGDISIKANFVHDKKQVKLLWRALQYAPAVASLDPKLVNMLREACLECFDLHSTWEKSLTGSDISVVDTSLDEVFQRRSKPASSHVSPKDPDENSTLSPQGNNKQPAGTCGILNLGNSCFGSSIVQILLRLPSLLSLINKLVDDPVCRSLIEIKTLYDSSKFPVINPKKLYDAVNLHVAPHFHGHQEDVGEVLDSIMQYIGSLSERVFEYNHVQNLLKLELIYNITCGHCKSETETYDEGLQIAVSPTAKSASLTDLLRETLKTGVPFENKCANCGRRSWSTMRTSLKRVGEVFIVYISRFKREADGFIRNNGLVELAGDELDLRQFMIPQGFQRGPYRLVGFVEHQGTPLNGHYQCVTFNEKDGFWYRYNDQHVTTADGKLTPNTTLCVFTGV